MDGLTLLQKIIIWTIPLIFAITVHEVAHGWVADKLGDPTAKMLGRLTLNPIKHIDLIGTIIVPLALLLIGGFVFGWAKPVPITWQNLKHPKRDTALVAVAGPLANLIMLFIWAVITKLATYVSNPLIALIITTMGQIGIMINIVLMVLNILPIPPLDGSRVVSSMLPNHMAYQYNKLEPFGFIILIALIATQTLGKVMYPVVYGIQSVISQWFGF